MQLQNPTQKSQSLKSLITEILSTYNAYDCLPINSSINSIDSHASLHDVLNVVISQNINEILIWDENENRWIWMLNFMDIIRLITQTLKIIIIHQRNSNNSELNLSQININYHNFYHRQQKTSTIQSINLLSSCTSEQIQYLKLIIQRKTLRSIIIQIVDQSQHIEQQINIQNGKETFKQQKEVQEQEQNIIKYHNHSLKSVPKESKLSHIILTMIVEKIHHILIEDMQSKMFMSIINFKDILLYLVRITNQSSVHYQYNINIKSLLDTVKQKKITIYSDSLIWQAFHLMYDKQHSSWICVINRNSNQFCGMLFHEDFRSIFKGWNINYLWMSIYQFIQHKYIYNKTQILPEFRMFQLEQLTKDIIWKIVMTRRNALVCLDSNNQIIYALGLMELFSLFVQ